MNPLLEVKDLRSWFRNEAGPARAVDGISFAIEKGETYALVGESGSGKSVTALSIMRLLSKPAGYIAGGSIRLKGRNIVESNEAEMRTIRGNQISMIFQEPMSALNPVLSIGSQIAEVFRLHRGMRRAEARIHSIEMLRQVGIPDPAKLIDEYPHQISGGMQQRVMIAMALACHPRLLIADEPTTALDVTIQSQILELIANLREKLDAAVLLITHDMGVVRENADRVGVMYAGKLVEEAPTDELFARPAHPYTRLLMKALPSRSVRHQRLQTIEGLVPKATEVIPGCRFSNRCPAAIDSCRTEEPKPVTVSDGHSAACRLLSDNNRHSSVRTEVGPAPPVCLDRATTMLQTNDLKMHFPVYHGIFKRITGYVKAVDGVSLSVRKGETVALVGESGCGKTTVGQSIIRLLKPTGGSVNFLGSDLTRLDRKELKAMRRSMQFVFQDPFASLDPRQMIGDALEEVFSVHKIGGSRDERRERAQVLLGRVGLDPGIGRRYPHEFSGGQRQRIALARALATEPRLLICDEATSALDVSVQARILNLLKDLQSEMGLSYLFITHDMSVVRYLADRVSVMYLGKIVEEGTSDEIFGNACHPYTRALLSAVPRVDEGTGRKKITLSGDVPSPAAPPNGCHFHPRCPQATPQCSRSYPEPIAVGGSQICRCIRATVG